MDENSGNGNENLVQLSANFFRIVSDSDWALHRYTVNFEPEESRAEQYKLMLQEHRDMLGCFYLDGVTLCCAKKPPLEFPPNENCQITAEHLGEMKIGDHRYGLMYNMLCKNIMESLNLQMLGRYYFDLNNAGAKVPIDNSLLELWTGYQVSIQEHDDGLMLRVDVETKIMSQITAYDILEQVMSNFGTECQEEFRVEMLGNEVWTEYDNKLHRIDDVVYNMTPLSNVQFGENSLDMTYKEYHKIEHNIDIYHSSQPLLVAHVKGFNHWSPMEKIYLIPELCIIAGMPTSLKRDTVMQESLSARTVLSPEDRVAKLEEFNQRIQNNPKVQKEFMNFGVKLESKLVQVTGTVLPPQILIFGDDCQVNVPLEGDWSQALTENKLLHTVDLHNWVVLTPQDFANQTKNFVAAIMKSTRNFKVTEPRYIELEDCTPESYGSHLQKAINEFDPQLVLIGMERRNRDVFSRIMQKCHRENSIPCQVFTDKCFVPETQEEIATRVAVQLSCKTGGAPWSIHVPLKHLMVVGISVSRDAENSNRNWSALVASLDKGVTRYFSTVSGHSKPSELTQNIISNLEKALEKFMDLNEGELPSRIICYRELNHEKQIANITMHEVARIQSALNAVYAGEPVKWAYILVSNFPQTRFFKGNGNPLPGTAIQESVTRPLRRDFYLISKRFENDATTATYYNIISDTSKLSPERIQILTYKLTHMYFNHYNQARSPAPLMHATKLARRVAQSIHAPLDRKLQDVLYYL